MKSDIRRMAERLLDISLNQSQTGRIIGRNRDTVRRMRLRAQDAALTVEKLADLTDSELRKILRPEFFSSLLERRVSLNFEHIHVSMS